MSFVCSSWRSLENWPDDKTRIGSQYRLRQSPFQRCKIVFVIFFSIVECCTAKVCNVFDCLYSSCASRDTSCSRTEYRRRSWYNEHRTCSLFLNMGLRGMDTTSFRNFITRWLLVFSQRWKKQRKDIRITHTFVMHAELWIMYAFYCFRRQ